MKNMRVPEILYEDNHLIAAFKRPGQTVQPEPGKPPSLEEELKAFLKEKYKKPGAVFLGVIHRIDMPVCGLVLFAKTSKALARMNEIFQKREVKKYYFVRVEGKPPEAHERIAHYLRRDEKKNFSKAFLSEVSNSVKAELEYECIEGNAKQSLLRILLLSGRKHQIRAQLSAIGCPIEGDVKYGAHAPLPDQSIALQSYALEFIHPVSQEALKIQCSHIVI